MRALRLTAPKKAEVVEAPEPKMPDDYILVSVKAVSLNPTDWKHVQEWAKPTESSGPLTVGCDYAGEIVAVGSAVTKQWRKGDRVFGVVHGTNMLRPDGGSFAELAIAKGDLQMRIPDDMDFEHAAALGMGVATVGQGLYQALGLPWPSVETDLGSKGNDKTAILIYGGSTAMGAYGIQFAVASGLEVYSTSSPHNFEYVKSLGAKEVFDYKSASCGSDIRKATSDNLQIVWDSINEGTSPQICADAMTSKPQQGKKPRYAGILAGVPSRDDIQVHHTIMYTSIGEEWPWAGKTRPARPEDFEFMKKFVKTAEDLIARGIVKPHNIEVREGGLDGILDGLRDLEDGKLSGAKLIYRI